MPKSSDLNELKGTGSGAAGGSTTAIVSPVPVVTLEQLTGDPRPFEGYFLYCFRNSGHTPPVGYDMNPFCPMHLKDKPIIIPSDYKIVIYDKDRSPEGFKPTSWPGWTMRKHDTTKYIDTGARKIYFGYIRCPKCAMAEFAHKVSCAESSGSRDASGDGRNIRRIWKTALPALCGLYQSLGDVWDHNLKDNEEYQDLRERRRVMEALGENWVDMEPHIPGTPQASFYCEDSTDAVDPPPAYKP